MPSVLFDGVIVPDGGELAGTLGMDANALDFEIVLCADRAGLIHDDMDTMRVEVDATFADVPAPDVLMVPGGFITRRLARDRAPIV